MSTSLDAVRVTLRTHPGGMTAKQVADAMQIARSAASNRLSRLTAYGHAEKLHPIGQHAPVYRILPEAKHA